MEQDLDIISIDGKNYIVMQELPYDDKTFLFLSSCLDEDDVLIRKTYNTDRSKVLPLEDENEFELACNLLLNTVVGEE